MPQQPLPQAVSDAITQIKKTHENFMVSVGVLTGTILIIYFFTYGALVDSVSSSLIWFEVITSVIMLFVLIFLRRICFALTKLKLEKRDGYAAILGKIEVVDLALKGDVLIKKLAS
ncbi:MAG: hypothetical protein COB30_015510 [Ectothiorhodospiraceae bacterium]|nr:hypothetical protein [Ectothiorhodospiraceae bacterium]